MSDTSSHRSSDPSSPSTGKRPVTGLSSSSLCAERDVVEDGLADTSDQVLRTLVDLIGATGVGLGKMVVLPRPNPGSFSLMDRYETQREERNGRLLACLDATVQGGIEGGGKIRGRRINKQRKGERGEKHLKQ